MYQFVFIPFGIRDRQSGNNICSQFVLQFSFSLRIIHSHDTWTQNLNIQCTIFNTKMDHQQMQPPQLTPHTTTLTHTHTKQYPQGNRTQKQWIDRIATTPSGNNKQNTERCAASHATRSFRRNTFQRSSRRPSRYVDIGSSHLHRIYQHVEREIAESHRCRITAVAAIAFAEGETS